MTLFERALASADEAQLRVFGETVTFHDPDGDASDCELKVVFMGRDVPEPPKNMGASKGQYSTAWTRREYLPVEDPTGKQLLITSEESYWIRSATAEDGGLGAGGVTMKLHRVRA